MKEFDLIIKNGTVVTSTESFLCDVAVKDGKIAAMAQNIEADAKEIYDAAGKISSSWCFRCTYTYGYAIWWNCFR